MTNESIRILGLTQKLGKNLTYRYHFEPRSSTYGPREEIIPCFTRQSLSHHDAPVYGEECVVKVVKNEKTIIRKTTYDSVGPDVTLRNTRGHKNSDVSKHASAA